MTTSLIAAQSVSRNAAHILYRCSDVHICIYADEKRALRKARLFFHKRCISNYRVFLIISEYSRGNYIESSLRQRRKAVKRHMMRLAARSVSCQSPRQARFSGNLREWNTSVLSSPCGSSITVLFHYFLLHSLGVTQVPVALQTTIGSSKKSAAEALMSGLACTTFLASKDIFLEVLPIFVISP